MGACPEQLGFVKWSISKLCFLRPTKDQVSGRSWALRRSKQIKQPHLSLLRSRKPPQFHVCKKAPWGPKSMCISWLVIHSPTLSPEGCPCAPPTSAPEEASFPRLLPTTGIFLLFKFANLRDEKMVFYTHLHFFFRGEWKHFFPMCFLAIWILSTTNCLFISFAYYFSRIFFSYLIFPKKVYLAIFSIPYFRM